MKNKMIIKNQQGYTLVEVMIAVAIFAVGIMAIFSMQIAATRGNATARETTEALSIAQDTMESLLALQINHANINDRNGDGAAGLFAPTRVQVLAGGNALLPDGGANQPDFARRVRPDGIREYYVYWNVNNIGVNSREICVIVAWNSSGLMRSMKRVQLRYIRI